MLHGKNTNEYSHNSKVILMVRDIPLKESVRIFVGLLQSEFAEIALRTQATYKEQLDG
jgi:hypothetical protein